MESTEHCINEFMEELGVQVDEATELYRELVKELLNNAKDINKLLPKKDWPEIKALVHNVKGISVNYKVLDVYEKALLCDRLLRENDIEDIEVHIKELLQLIQKSENKIKSYFAKFDIEL